MRKILSEKEIHLLRKMADEGYTNIALAKKFEISPATASKIRNGKESYKYLCETLNI